MPTFGVPLSGRCSSFKARDWLYHMIHEDCMRHTALCSGILSSLAVWAHTNTWQRTALAHDPSWLSICVAYPRSVIISKDAEPMLQTGKMEIVGDNAILEGLDGLFPCFRMKSSVPPEM